MPKLYLAICKGVSGHYFVTNHFYETETEAKDQLGDCFMGLFRTGPSIDIKTEGPSVTSKNTVSHESKQSEMTLSPS